MIEHEEPASVLIVAFEGQVTTGASSSFTVIVIVHVVVFAGVAPSVAVYVTVTREPSPDTLYAPAAIVWFSTIEPDAVQLSVGDSWVT